MADTENQQQGAGAQTEELDASLLDQILQETKLAPSDDGYDVAKKGVAAFISELLKPTDGQSQVSGAAVDMMITEIDKKLSDQVDQIIHNEDFKTLESAWRSLKFVVDRTDFRQNIKIEMMSVSKDELAGRF
jgi:type VI secretion system protein ImpC